MNRIVSFIAALAVVALGSLALATPSLAVDPTISALCRDGAPEAYSRPGGVCEIIASNKSLAPTGSGGGCPAGFEHNPAPPPKCIPEVPELSAS